LTECSDLSEVEAEETEMAVVAVKMVETAEAIEMAVVTITMAALTVKAAAALKTVAAVIITDGKAVADSISEGTLAHN
jgi:hypothetical protein